LCGIAPDEHTTLEMLI